jgi:hypothetical protein
MSEPKKRFQLDAELALRIKEATTRLAAAEHELTLAMEAVSAPILDADNEMVGERVRTALHELRAARKALELEQVVP